MEDAYQIALGAGADSDSDSEDADVAITKSKSKEPLAVSMHGSFTWERGGGPGSQAAGMPGGMKGMFGGRGMGGPPGMRGGGAGENGDKKQTKAERQEAEKTMKEKMKEQKAKIKEEEKAYKGRRKLWGQGIPAQDGGAFEKGPEPFRLDDIQFEVSSCCVHMNACSLISRYRFAKARSWLSLAALEGEQRLHSSRWELALMVGSFTVARAASSKHSRVTCDAPPAISSSVVLWATLRKLLGSKISACATTLPLAIRTTRNALTRSFMPAPSSRTLLSYPTMSGPRSAKTASISLVVKRYRLITSVHCSD